MRPGLLVGRHPKRCWVWALETGPSAATKKPRKRPIGWKSLQVELW